MNPWRDFFPEKTPRPDQERVLDELTEKWADHDTFIFQGPPGTGKSAVAVCLGRWLASQRTLDAQATRTYITTLTVALQEQYENSYGKTGLAKLYSADRFSCHRGGGLTCADGSRAAGGSHSCSGVRKCPYREAKERFIRSDVGILNLAYYLNETAYGGELPRRGLMICDEAHAVPDAIMSFVALTITEENLSEFLVDPPSSFDTKEVLTWLKTDYLPPLQKAEELLRSECEKLVKSGATFDTPGFVDTCRNFKAVDRHACNVRRTLGHVNDIGWVVDTAKENFTLTPLSARGFIHDSLIRRNEKNLFMTATVLDRDAFEHELELEGRKTLYISLPSPFEAKRRQVFFIPSCKLKRDDLPGTTRSLAKGVRIILDHHPDDKGIIFVSSYAQAQELIKQVKDRRLLTHKTSDGKQYLMDKHADSKNSVIVSPSMHVGTDLKDDLSRFQVIAKLPFPSLGTTSVRTRSEQDPRWYAYKTALTLVQASGRSVRSETDHAVTYILDTDFGWFLKRWRSLFPDWWLDALKMP